MHKAALNGSSHYALPAILRWFTANIGVRHVHHLSSTIFAHRLPLSWSILAQQQDGFVHEMEGGLRE